MTFIRWLLSTAVFSASGIISLELLREEVYLKAHSWHEDTVSSVFELEEFKKEHPTLICTLIPSAKQKIDIYGKETYSRDHDIIATTYSCREYHGFSVPFEEVIEARKRHAGKKGAGRLFTSDNGWAPPPQTFGSM